MTIKTIEQLEELLELTGQWVRARKMLDEARVELREAEWKLSEAVMNAADSADPNEDAR